MDKPPKDAVNAQDVGSNLSQPDLQPLHPSAQNGAAAPSATKAVTVLDPKARSRRKSTGPRTAIGKQRSSLNAQKHGIFSKSLLVRDESPCEFRILLEGLLDDLKPEGTLEKILVDQLATILWRRQRVIRAETAEIDRAILFSLLDSIMHQVAEVWDCSRSGESTGGMLKHQDNPLLLRQAINMLTTVRDQLRECGFQRDPWLLRKLYGLDHDGTAPYSSIFQIYLNHSKKAAQNPQGTGGTDSAEERKNKMLKILNEEIKGFEEFLPLCLGASIERNQLDEIGALVPSPPVSERLLRYETHLSREFDRTLSQLERLQRMRLGKPVLPPINVQVS